MGLFRRKKIPENQIKHFNIENHCSVKTIIDDVIVSTVKIDDPCEIYHTQAFPYEPGTGAVRFDRELYFAESKTLDDALQTHMRSVRHFLGIEEK